MKPYIIPDPPDVKQAATPDPDGHQTGQDRPHTLPHGGNRDTTIDAIDDAEAMQPRQVSRDFDGAQQGQGRGFATHPSERDKHNTVGETAAHAGNLDRLTFNSSNQGISNHAASEEAVSQKNVTDARPDALESINQNLKPRT